MNENEPSGHERSGIIEAGELIPVFAIVYGFTLVLALLA
jgi:hypothetical protein